MLDKLFSKLGYIKKEKVLDCLEIIIKDIRAEINRCSKHPNIGKQGCLRRIQNLYINLGGIK